MSVEKLMEDFHYCFAIDFYKFAPVDNRHRFRLYQNAREPNAQTSDVYQFDRRTKIFKTVPPPAEKSHALSSMK